MARKILLLGVALIMSLGIFTACSSGLRFKVGYEGKGYVNGAFAFTDASGEEIGTHNSLRLITSVEELKAFCDELNNPAFSVDSPKYSSNLSKQIREYDEAFFTEKTLVICLLTASNAGISYTVKALAVEGTTLLVDVKQQESKRESATVITPWTFLIEVKNTDIIGVISVRLKS